MATLPFPVSFVIGGTQKGGTSALEAFVRQHPEICMAHSCKEVHFFDRDENFQTGPDYERFHSFFKPEPAHKVIGEATPVYMYWEPALERIWKYNATMKWILVLRNPVKRAFSGWNMEHQRQRDPLPFGEAVEKEAARCREPYSAGHRVFSYVDRGFYAYQVRRLFRMFDKENCLVILNEDLSQDHAGTLRRVFQFLGVDDQFLPPAKEVFKHPYDEKIDPGVYERLMAGYYHDIKQLEGLIGRDLSDWYAGSEERVGG